MSKPQRWTIHIMNYDVKTKCVALHQTLRTKPLDLDGLESVIKNEMSKPFNKNACWYVKEARSPRK